MNYEIIGAVGGLEVSFPESKHPAIDFGVAGRVVVFRVELSVKIGT
jgi:hypothetical protein